MDLALIQRLEPNRYDGPALAAKQGLYLLGYTCIDFDAAEWESVLPDEPFILVGGIWTVRSTIQKLGKLPPPNVDYPEELLPFLGRTVAKSTLGEFQDGWNLQPEPKFIKPYQEHKAFTGVLIKELRDFRRTYGLPRALEIWVVEPVEWLSEFRVFVQSGEIIGCQHYKGDPLRFPDPVIIQSTVEAYQTAPKAYCADFGVVKDGRTLLVEVNDGHSAGSYGLEPMRYARWIEARWCELTGWAPRP